MDYMKRVRHIKKYPTYRWLKAIWMLLLLAQYGIDNAVAYSGHIHYRKSPAKSYLDTPLRNYFLL